MKYVRLKLFWLLDDDAVLLKAQWPDFQRTWLTLKDLTMDSLAGQKELANDRRVLPLVQPLPIKDQHNPAPGAYVLSLSIGDLPRHNTVINHGA